MQLARALDHARDTRPEQLGGATERHVELGDAAATRTGKAQRAIDQLFAAVHFEQHLHERAQALRRYRQIFVAPDRHDSETRGLLEKRLERLTVRAAVE